MRPDAAHWGIPLFSSLGLLTGSVVIQASQKIDSLKSKSIKLG
jgi:hypothetical protein